MSSPAPRISVITVVRNGEATLRRTIESVLARLGHSGEYLIVDGASTDKTVDIIREYRDALHCWTSEPDKGIYDAMNKGLRQARGDWVIFMGADDELLVNLDQVADDLVDPSAVYYGNVSLTSSGAVSAGRFNRYKLMQQNICHQAIFYPRQVYEAKPYSIDAGLIADHKYNIELWGAGVPFRYLPRVIAKFNDSGVSSVAQPQFEILKLQSIQANFGPAFYCLKLARTAAVHLLKRSKPPVQR